MKYKLEYVEKSGFKVQTAVVSEDQLTEFCKDKIVTKIERISE